MEKFTLSMEKFSLAHSKYPTIRISLNKHFLKICVRTNKAQQISPKTFIVTVLSPTPMSSNIL